MLFLYYPKCSTCQKAKKWLDSHGIVYTERYIHEDRPSCEELEQWYKDSGLPLKRFFNTSGLLYKSMNLKSRLPELKEEEQLKLLASDGMLVKRPILVWEEENEEEKTGAAGEAARKSRVLVGFREAEWESALARKE